LATQSIEISAMSITKDQLIQYLEKPWLLKEQSIVELKEIIDEFPYFQTAQLLYTYNLCTRDNFRYTSYLKTCSIFATDRTILYRLLQPKSAQNIPVAPKKPIETKKESTTGLFEFADDKQIGELIDQPSQQVESSNDDLIDFDLLSFEQPDDLFQLDESETVIASPPMDFSSMTTGTKTEEKIDLIDQFIKINPTIQPRNDTLTPQNNRFEPKEEVEPENDEFITETLSRIYLKQGHHQKAIDSFKRLSLKFPEKSVYFAQQIEEIKKLLN